MKQVTLNIKFPKNFDVDLVETLIKNKFKEKGIETTKFRHTYVESVYGLAEMPKNLFLALLISNGGTGFGWYLYKLSGKYVFRFRT